MLILIAILLVLILLALPAGRVALFWAVFGTAILAFYAGVAYLVVVLR